MQLLGLSVNNARSHMRSLLWGQELVSVPRSYARFDPAVADATVAFILSPDNIKRLSWGTKKLFDEDFPHLVRQKVPAMMLQAYYQHFPETSVDGKRQRFGASSFLKVVDAITEPESDSHVASIVFCHECRL